MNVWGVIITLLLSSIILFLVGYNFTFNTNRTIARCISLSNYKEGSKMQIRLSSKSNALWMKIIGFGIMIFTLIQIALMIVLFINN